LPPSAFAGLPNGAGFLYLDTTLALVVMAPGLGSTGWVNPVTGASV